MSYISPKELKKLAKACREAGIKAFKGPNFEFTLDDLPPVTLRNSSKKEDLPVEFQSDNLTDEQILFYSVTDLKGTEHESN